MFVHFPISSTWLLAVYNHYSRIRLNQHLPLPMQQHSHRKLAQQGIVYIHKITNKVSLFHYRFTPFFLF
ncbi:hypothetical protein JHK82_020002 [Glycine max]|uniref:Uncharacterized protein n=2 Tax=Glycine subgen. Soja TaxID=1462606 RepID=A0A0R0J979_SOYBN|nr:hypothetical protein JHK85_020452 [Glycine max]KAG5039185.1 hypothetical protein JHK86_020025 [Glycine max]KAG5144307.1 hypothetical protein JHK82_020002 [Glycine max]KAH1088923.1 hypothetical protein GYH30_019747 [Glycine max]RZC04941.1 hypothetical protein D0Y65_019147 [Glycine soja]